MKNDTGKRRLPGYAKFLIAVLIVAAIAIPTSLAIHKHLRRAPAPPTTVVVSRGDMIVSVSETGTLQPADQINVESKVAGRLLTIAVHEGQKIQPGQLIATVDRSALDPQIASARAQLSQAVAHFDQTKAQYTLQVSQSNMAISQAQAMLGNAQAHLQSVAAGARPQEVAEQQEAVDRAQIAYDDAQRTLKRNQSLLDKGYVAQSVVDTSQVASDTALSNLSAAKQALALTLAGPRPEDIQEARTSVTTQRVALQTARTNIGQNAVTFADIAQAKASVQQLQYQLDQLLVQLSDTTIVAPGGGIVLKRYKQPGEIVQSSLTGFSDEQSEVVMIGNHEQVTSNVNEVDIPKVHNNASVIVTVDALPGATIYGHVVEIAPASSTFSSSSSSSTDSSSGAIPRFNVRIDLDSPNDQLRPGMTAEVQIIGAKHRNVLIVPQEALPFTGSTGTVTVLTKSGVKQPRAIAVGLRNDTQAEVLKGLAAGDKVVVPPVDGADRRKIDFGAN